MIHRKYENYSLGYMQTISGPFQFGNSTFEWGGGKSCDDAGFLEHLT